MSIQSLVKKLEQAKLSWMQGEEIKIEFIDTCIDLGKQVIAEAEKQEPVAWMSLMKEARDNCKASIVEDGISSMRKEYRIDLERRLTDYINTHPQPKREWVGLTVMEAVELDIATNHPREFAAAIEAKLKEKNFE